MRLWLGLSAIACMATFGVVASCGTDTFTPLADGGADGASEASRDAIVPDAPADVALCVPPADAGLWFCSSFDPPQSAVPPYGWTSVVQTCDGGGVPPGLDTQRVKSPPVSMRIRRNGACGAYLNYLATGAQRPTTKLVASLFSADLPVTSSSTILFEGIWNAGDGGPARFIWVVVVRDGDFVLRILRNAALEQEVVVAPYVNARWHDVEITATATTDVTATIDGVTKTLTTAPRPSSTPYFLVGPWANTPGGTSDVFLDDVLIYEP